MRFQLAIVILVTLAACDSSQADRRAEVPPGMAAEVTVELPPAPEPTKVAMAGPDGTTATYALGPAEPADLSTGWAGVLRQNGFSCDRITSARQLEGEGGQAMGIYKIDCGNGAAYQGTRRDGRVRFRRWTGQISRV